MTEHRPDADPFNIYDRVHSGEVPRLSPSKLNTADVCMKRLEFDMDPSIPYETDEVRATGTGYHAGLEYYYRGRMLDVLPTDIALGTLEYDEIVAAATDSFDVESYTDGFTWSTKAEDRGKAHARITDMLATYFGGGFYWPAEYEVVGVEYSYVLPLFIVDGEIRWATKAIIDLILRDPHGWLKGIDHKSGKKTWRKGKESHRQTVQAPWYVMSMRALFPDDNIDTTFNFDVMTYDGKFERRGVTILPQHEEGVYAKAALVCQVIDQGGPFLPITGTALCSKQYCDHWQRCPWGEQFETGVPVEVAVSV